MKSAQEATPPVAARQSDASTGVTTRDDTTVIAEIIVTAQRRSENLQDVPIAVTAATAEMRRPVRTSERKPTRGKSRPLTALAMGQPITIGVIALPASVGEPPRIACT